MNLILYLAIHGFVCFPELDQVRVHVIARKASKS